jgi:hypothetical protein
MMDTEGPAQIQELVDFVAARTGAPTTLEDRELHLVASSGHEEIIDEVRRTSILRRRSSPDVQRLFESFGIARAEGPLRIPAGAAPGLFARWCVPMRWRGVAYGYLWLLDPDEAVPVEVVRNLTDVADQLAVSMARRSRAGDRTAWTVTELLSADAGARARAAEEMQRDGLIPAGREVVLIGLARRDGGPVGPVNPWLLPRGVLSAAIGRRAALVLPAGTHDAVDVADRAARSLLTEHNDGIAAGVSGTVPATAGHTGWRQVDAAIRVALQTPADRVAVRAWDRLGVLRLLSLAEPHVVAEVVIDAGVRRLLDGDSQLLLTARTYLDLAGNVQRTAAALGIHRQTLYHRLRRIAGLSGYNLDDGTDRLTLHLALHLASL